MNILLIFFALPIATIIISIALQKILKCPSLVAAIIFAIFLIVTFVINNLNFLIAAIAYAIISFITAWITCLIVKFFNRMRRESVCCSRREEENCNSFARETLCCGNNGNSDVLTISNNHNNCNQNDNGCSYQITNDNGLSARINIIPNTTNNNNGNTNGCCRRK